MFANLTYSSSPLPAAAAAARGGLLSIERLNSLFIEHLLCTVNVYSCINSRGGLSFLVYSKAHFEEGCATVDTCQNGFRQQHVVVELSNKVLSVWHNSSPIQLESLIGGFLVCQEEKSFFHVCVCLCGRMRPGNVPWEVAQQMRLGENITFSLPPTP